MKNLNSKRIFAAALILFGLLSAAAAQTSAQAAKKKTKRATKPVVQTLPVEQSEPQIVSRAEDFQNQNQTQPLEIAPQTETAETLEQKVDKVNDGIKDLKSRVRSLEASQKNEFDEKQKRILLNLDILSRAEQRAESLRRQLFELIEKENGVRTRLEQINYEARPENLDRAAAFAGSLRPEEIRDQRRKSLEVEKRNLETLLTQIQTSRAALEENVRKADVLVEKVRARSEREIDAALVEEKND